MIKITKEEIIEDLKNQIKSNFYNGYMNELQGISVDDLVSKKLGTTFDSLIEEANREFKKERLKL